MTLNELFLPLHNANRSFWIQAYRGHRDFTNDQISHHQINKNGQMGQFSMANILCKHACMFCGAIFVRVEQFLSGSSSNKRSIDGFFLSNFVLRFFLERVFSCKQLTQFRFKELLFVCCWEQFCSYNVRNNPHTTKDWRLTIVMTWVVKSVIPLAQTLISLVMH